MSLTLKGLEELLTEFDQLDKKVKNKIAKEAIEEASEVMLESIKQTAPKAEKNSTRSFSHLKKDIIKKGGTVKANMGINKDNWERTKGLYFHYFGFRSHPRDTWMDKGYDNAKARCEQIMINKIKEGLNK